jgi:hypothetical protein
LMDIGKSQKSDHPVVSTNHKPIGPNSVQTRLDSRQAAGETEIDSIIEPPRCRVVPASNFEGQRGRAALKFFFCQ